MIKILFLENDRKEGCNVAIENNFPQKMTKPNQVIRGGGEDAHDSSQLIIGQPHLKYHRFSDGHMQSQGGIQDKTQIYMEMVGHWVQAKGKGGE